MSYAVKTRAYTGPFDLLLQLVSRQKVAIGSIPVAEVADQYLAETGALEDLDLDVASDFVLVAATLLAMKAASLLPDDGEASAGIADDDEEDLASLSPDEARDVLAARLLTYKQFRNAASALATRMESEALMFGRSAGADPEFLGLMPNYLEGITLRSLAVICADLDSRCEGLLLEAEHVAPRRRPIALTVAAVDRMARARGEVGFDELLGGDRRPQTVVATFLAILELDKRGMVTLAQEAPFANIQVSHVPGAAAFEAEDSDLTSIEEG